MNPELQQPGAMPQGNMQPGTMPTGMPSMSEADMDADLQDRFDMISRKKAELDTRKITDKNRLEKMKQEILGSFFKSMQDLGVDLSDQASISQFLQDLEKKDPDFVALLETAFSVLGPEQPSGPQSGKGLMNQFGGLQENVLQNTLAGQEVPAGIIPSGEPVEEAEMPEAGGLPPEMQL